MTIKELIEELNKYNPDTLVMVNGYEGGYDDISNIGLEYDIVLNYHTASYYGSHESESMVTNKERLQTAQIVNALILS